MPFAQLIPCLHSLAIDHIRDNPVTLTEPVPFVFCAAEMSHSMCSIVTIAGSELPIVIGVEDNELIPTPEKLKTLLTAHFWNIRSIPQCSKSTIVFDIRGTRGFDSHEYVKTLKKSYEPILVVPEFEKKPWTDCTFITQSMKNVFFTGFGLSAELLNTDKVDTWMDQLKQFHYVNERVGVDMYGWEKTRSTIATFNVQTLSFAQLFLRAVWMRDAYFGMRKLLV